jgi:hypothetical protein
MCKRGGPMSAAADTAAAVSEAAARARGGQVPILARHDATSTRLKELLGAPFLASPWLARLGRVSFLGTLDLHPGSVHASTRLDHSLGVAGLGLQVGAGLGLSPADLRLLATACLLHDIGHYPLSHAAEPGFQRALGVAHHGVSEWIVRGNGSIPPAQSLRPALERAGIDPDLLWAVIVGEAAPPHAALSSLLLAPINLDTLDGIVRTARSFGRRGMKLPPILFRRDGDQLMLDSTAIPALDRFWALKDRMYGEVINLPSNIVAEAELSRAVADRFGPTIFAGFAGFDDQVLASLADAAARHAGLLTGADDRFCFAGRRVAGDDLPRVRKRYFVDRRVEPGATRPRQRRLDPALPPRPPARVRHPPAPRRAAPAPGPGQLRRRPAPRRLVAAARRRRGPGDLMRRLSRETAHEALR